MATLPVWKANGTAASGVGAISVPWPAGHASGDFAILAVNSSNEAIATPSGWTPFGTNTGTGTAAAADSCMLALFYRFATSGAESNAAVADSGNHTLGVISTFTGVDPTTPIETISAYTTKSTNSTSDTFPGLTTAGPNRLVVCAISTGQESVKSSPTFAGLGSFTARGVGTTTSGVDGGIALFSGTKVAAGATGTGSVTESITSKAISVTFALKPADFDQTITGSSFGSDEAFGSHEVAGVSPQTITLTASIASAEAFGTAKLNQIVYASAVASAEAFGTAQLNQIVYASAIVSAEAHGTARITQVVAASAIASAEAFGTASLTQVVAVSAIASAEAFGTAQLNQIVYASAIASAEAFGTAVILYEQFVLPAGLASAEAVGTASLAQLVAPSAIASTEVFGAPTLAQVISVTAIAGAEEIGVAALSLVLYPVGISSNEAHGTPQINLVLSVASIDSEEAFGSHSVGAPVQQIEVAGIAGAEAFGTAQLDQLLAMAAIVSEEAVGEPAISVVFVEIVPSAIDGGEAFGVAAVLRGVVNITPDPFLEDGAFGTPLISLPVTDVTLLPLSIGSQEAVGWPTFVGACQAFVVVRVSDDVPVIRLVPDVAKVVVRLADIVPSVVVGEDAVVVVVRGTDEPVVVTIDCA